MKRPHLSRMTAPSPRLTLWVPALAAAVLSGLWLALLALGGILTGTF
jgi:hypothetical protein